MRKRCLIQLALNVSVCCINAVQPNDMHIQQETISHDVSFRLQANQLPLSEKISISVSVVFCVVGIVLISVMSPLLIVFGVLSGVISIACGVKGYLIHKSYKNDVHQMRSSMPNSVVLAVLPMEKHVNDNKQINSEVQNHFPEHDPQKCDMHIAEQPSDAAAPEPYTAAPSQPQSSDDAVPKPSPAAPSQHKQSEAAVPKPSPAALSHHKPSDDAARKSSPAALSLPQSSDAAAPNLSSAVLPQSKQSEAVVPKPSTATSLQPKQPEAAVQKPAAVRLKPMPFMQIRPKFFSQKAQAETVKTEPDVTSAKSVPDTPSAPDHPETIVPLEPVDVSDASPFVVRFAQISEQQRSALSAQLYAMEELFASDGRMPKTATVASTSKRKKALNASQDSLFDNSLVLWDRKKAEQEEMEMLRSLDRTKEAINSDIPYLMYRKPHILRELYDAKKYPLAQERLHSLLHCVSGYSAHHVSIINDNFESLKTECSEAYQEIYECLMKQFLKLDELDLRPEEQESEPSDSVASEPWHTKETSVEQNIEQPKNLESKIDDQVSIAALCLLAAQQNKFKVLAYLCDMYSDIVAQVTDGEGHDVWDYAQGNAMSLVMLKSYNVPRAVSDAVSVSIDINAKDRDGLTPLMHACKNRDTKLLEWLLSQGADLQATDNKGMTPLMYACAKGDFQVPEALLNCDINAQDNNGMTPLMYALQSNNQRVYKALIKRCADVLLQDKGGMTALMHAAQCEEAGAFLSVKDMLEEYGHQLCGMSDNSGMTALMYASSNRKAKMAQTFLSYPEGKREIGMKDEERNTALVYAVIFENYEAISDLTTEWSMLDEDEVPDLFSLIDLSSPKRFHVLNALLKHPGFDLGNGDVHAQSDMFLKYKDQIYRALYFMPTNGDLLQYVNMFMKAVNAKLCCVMDVFCKMWDRSSDIRQAILCRLKKYAQSSECMLYERYKMALDVLQKYGWCDAEGNALI